MPLNARLVVEVQDGRLSSLRDSLQNEELKIYSVEEPVETPAEEPVEPEQEPEVETPEEDPEPVFVQ